MKPVTERLRDERRAPRPPQRWRPNLLGRMAASAASAPWVLLVSFALATLSLGIFASQSLKIDLSDEGLRYQDQPAAAALAALQSSFPGLGPGIIATVTSRTPGLARRAAGDLARALEARSDIYADVFAPGTGRFFDEFGLLYLSTPEVERIVRRLQQSAPLFHALAAAPDLGGLAGLADQTARAVAAGRSPSGLDGLFQEAARAIAGEINGAPHPLDWQQLVEHTPSLNDQRWFVIAQTKDRAAGLAVVRELIQSFDQTFGKAVTVTLSGPVLEAMARQAPRARSLLLSAGIAAVLMVIALAACIGRANLLLAILFPAFAAMAASAAGAAILAVSAPVELAGALAVAFALAGGPAIALSLRYDEEMAHERTQPMAIRIAGHYAGAIAFHAALFVLLAMAPLFFMPGLQLAGFAMLCCAISLATPLMVLLITPAILRLAPSDPWHAGGHWLDHALNGAPASGGKKIVALLLVMAAVFGFAAMAGRDAPPAAAATPLHVLAERGKAAPLIAALKTVGEVAKVRWVESFLPPFEAVNRQRLAELRGQFPDAIETPAPRSPEEARAAVARLAESLGAIAASEAAAPELKQAAAALRRSLDLFTSPSPPGSLAIAKLEKTLFAGLPLLLQRIDRLARLAPLNINTLDPRIVRRFVAADIRWRMEVSPAPGASARSFLAGVRSVAPDAIGESVAAEESAGLLRRDQGRWRLAFAGLALVFAGLAIRNVHGYLIFLAAAAVAPAAAMGLAALTAAQISIGLIIAMAAAGAGIMPALCVAPIRRRENRAPPDEEDTAARAGFALQAAALALALPAITATDANVAALGMGLATASAATICALSCLQPLVGSLPGGRRVGR